MDKYLMITRTARCSKEVKTSVMQQIIHVSSFVLVKKDLGDPSSWLIWLWGPR